MPRSATVRATSKTVCLAVDTGATDRLATESERTHLLLMLYRVSSEFISARLRSTTEELIHAKRKIKELTT
jgi:CRP-like cAMP-binding protein